MMFFRTEACFLDKSISSINPKQTVYRKVLSTITKRYSFERLENLFSFYRMQTSNRVKFDNLMEIDMGCFRTLYGLDMKGKNEKIIKKK